MTWQTSWIACRCEADISFFPQRCRLKSIWTSGTMLSHVLFNHSCRWETCFRQRCFRWTLAQHVTVVDRFLPFYLHPMNVLRNSSFPPWGTCSPCFQRALQNALQIWRYKSTNSFFGSAVVQVWKPLKTYPCLFLISLTKTRLTRLSQRGASGSASDWIDQTAFGKGSARSFPAWIPMTSTTSYLVQVKALLGTKLTRGSNSIQKCQVCCVYTCKSETFHRTRWHIVFVHGRYFILFRTYGY